MPPGTHRTVAEHIPRRARECRHRLPHPRTRASKDSEEQRERTRQETEGQLRKHFKALRTLYLWKVYFAAHGWAFLCGGPRLFLREYPWPWQKIHLLRWIEQRVRPKRILFFDTDTTPNGRDHSPEEHLELWEQPLTPSPLLILSADNNGGNAGLLYFPEVEGRRGMEEGHFLPPHQANPPSRTGPSPSQQWRTLGMASLPLMCEAPHMLTGRPPEREDYLNRLDQTYRTMRLTG